MWTSGKKEFTHLDYPALHSYCFPEYLWHQSCTLWEEYSNSWFRFFRRRIQAQFPEKHLHLAATKTLHQLEGLSQGPLTFLISKSLMVQSSSGMSETDVTLMFSKRFVPKSQYCSHLTWNRHMESQTSCSVYSQDVVFVLLLTRPCSLQRVSMTRVCTFFSQTILQKSLTVAGRGPWAAMNSFLEL